MILYGKQLFLYMLEKMPEKIVSVYLSKECDKKIFNKIKRLNVPIERLDFKKAQALAKGGNHQGFFAKILPLEFTSLEALKRKNFLVMLYGLTDIGNIGAICRSVYALGADGLIVSNIKNLNLENILRTSSGAALNLPISLEVDGLSCINELKQVGFTIYASNMGGENIQSVSIETKKVLMMGNESVGIPKKALQRCDKVVSIPMARDFDSLNVSAATAILCDRIINR